MISKIKYLKGYLSGYKHKLDKRSGIRVYTYHNTVEKIRDSALDRNFHLLSEFESHVLFLKQFEVCSSTQLKEILQTKQGVKHGSLITFDDGYKGNLLAAECLAKHNIPAVFFISTAMMEQGSCVWTVELSLLLLKGNLEQLEFGAKRHCLKSEEERKLTFNTIRKQMKVLPASERKQKLNAIREQFPDQETQRLLESYPEFKMMNWDDLKNLQNQGFEIGSHGVDHEIQHGNQDTPIIERELNVSKSQLEENLSESITTLAYPNGDHCEFAITKAKETGYELAFTTKEACVEPEKEPMPLALPRIDPSRDLINFIRQYYWKV